MRKDVKLGLSIGGVLLACLIVYILVPKNNEGDQFAKQGDSTNSAGERQETANAGPGSTTPPAPHPEATTGPGTSSDPSHEASPTAPDHIPATGAGAGDPGNTVAATTPRSYDWERILTTGEGPKTPLLAMGTNRGPSDERPAAPDPFGDAPKGTNASNEPNWNGHGGAAGGPSVGTRNTQPPAATGGARSTPKEHVVQQGEHLSSIALAVYGDARLYKEILKANPGLDERKLKPGTTIKLPDASTFAAAPKAQPAAAKQEPTIDSNKEYRVAPGDNLHKIAVKLYGKPAKANDLYELNKDKIGDDSARVKVGMVLKLPEAPTASAAHPAR